jgi:amidase
MNTIDLCFAPATEIRRLLLRKAISVPELVRAHLEQIERVNPAVNAIVTLLAESALEQAETAQAALNRGDAVGVLHGLTVGVKDLFLTRGVRTTFGSPIFADFIPDTDHLIVEREKAAGAILIGKTNTPEFGAGAQTFNPVFGVTRNPYDLTKTCGGSSGGSAVALACGMVTLADGSDFGGSLRAPAAWCNVVGMRPSAGRVPIWPTNMAWSNLSVHGPMARTVADLALFFTAIAGPDPRSPIGIETPAERFAAPLERDFSEGRIAWSEDLGFLPVDPVITEVCNQARKTFEAIGCGVDDAHPDLRGASEVFKTLRAAKFAVDRRDQLEHHRDQLKATIIENAEAGLKLGPIDATLAEEQRTELWHRVRVFMQRYEFMVWPVNPVPPFPAEQETLTAIGDVKMDTYIDWGAFRHIVSLLGLPAISVPCGFTPEGLPVGLQIIGRHHADFEVLQLAHAFEQRTGYWKQRPDVAVRQHGVR